MAERGATHVEIASESIKSLLDDERVPAAVRRLMASDYEDVRRMLQKLEHGEVHIVWESTAYVAGTRTGVARETENAIGHLVNIYEYIAINSPTYGRRMVDRITRRSEQIAEQPLSGRKVPEYESEDIRELIETPYRIIYRIKPDQIDVLAVIHGARLLPDEI